MEGTHRPTHDASALRPGEILGRYELLMPVARGGMGQVWAARLHGTRGFQKIVALKTILPTNDDTGDLESMLFDEASLASLVRHPNVVETFDLGEREDGLLYLAMEWVAGESLDAILRAGARAGGVPMPLAVHLIAQGLKGLHAAHEARDSRGRRLGIVHRDVSPQNLLVTYAGVTKLIDFGIAKATQQLSQPTADGVVKGKFAYMAPEQLRSEPLDARADVFGMGIVLYRAVTGEHPFQSDNLAATIRKILVEEPRRPSEVAAHCPKALDDVLMHALAKDKSERFSSASDMLLALERAVPVGPRAQLEREGEAFMRRLFEPRMIERVRALQAALHAADAGLGAGWSEAKLLLPRSQPTMRAVSLEVPGNAATSENVPAATGPILGATRLPAHPKRRGLAAVPLGVLTVSALVIASLVHPRVRGGPSGASAGRAGSDVGIETPIAPPNSAFSVLHDSSPPLEGWVGVGGYVEQAPLASSSTPAAVVVPPTRIPTVTRKRETAATGGSAGTTVGATEPPADAAHSQSRSASASNPDPLSRRK